MAETHRRLVGVDFRSVPASDIPAVVERLAAAGWTWEEEKWMAIFTKAFGDAESAARGRQEIDEIMRQYSTAPEHETSG
jgi:hypothetical protein